MSSHIYFFCKGKFKISLQKSTFMDTRQETCKESVKIKKLALCLTIKHYAMKAYGGVDVEIHIFLTSALVGGEWSASRTGRFTSGERAPSIRWIGGWVDPRVGLDDTEKRIFLNLPGLELRPPVVRPVTSRHTYYAIPAPEGSCFISVSRYIPRGIMENRVQFQTE
jgi:hypothetical protein